MFARQKLYLVLHRLLEIDVAAEEVLVLDPRGGGCGGNQIV